jgi:hypothetical protein
MMGLAAKRGHLRTRTGPNDPALRKARVCYNHLAGELGVRMMDGFRARGFIAGDADELRLTENGSRFMNEFGIDLDTLGRQRRALCKPCLDWSARRTHLAGSLGTALLGKFYALGWATRRNGSRIVVFSPKGEREFNRLFPGTEA